MPRLLLSVLDALLSCASQLEEELGKSYLIFVNFVLKHLVQADRGMQLQKEATLNPGSGTKIRNGVTS